MQIGQLGHAIDQFGNFMAEFLFDLGIGCLGILDRVVQQGGDDGGVVQPLFGQNGGNGNRMREIGFARLAHLPVMHRKAIIIGLANQGFVGFGVIIADQCDQVFNRDHMLRFPVTGRVYP